jgi:hypothetical protein
MVAETVEQASVEKNHRTPLDAHVESIGVGRTDSSMQPGLLARIENRSKPK